MTVPTGIQTVGPAQTTTYVATATGPGGTATASVTVTVNQVPPTISFAASPDSILQGQSSTLNWTTTNATQIKIDNGIGSVHVGKYLEIEVSGEKETARKQLDEACHKFLSNPVIEDYRLEIE